jgi:hypothetical protein
LEVVGTKGMAEGFVGIQQIWSMAAIDHTKDREQLWQPFGNFRFFRFQGPDRTE